VSLAHLGAPRPFAHCVSATHPLTKQVLKQSIFGWSHFEQGIPTESECHVENSPRRQRNGQQRDGVYTHSLDSPDLETV